MSQEEYQGVIIPSSPEDRTRLKGMLNEMVDCMFRAAAEQDKKREIAVVISEEFELPKKLINKAASTMYKENLQQVAAEMDDLETLIETLKSNNAPQN